MVNKILSFCLLMTIATPALAWLETNHSAKDYPIKFVLHDHRSGREESFEITKSASDQEEANKEAASECARYFRHGRAHLSEDDKLDIVDACANPRNPRS